jgi:hypothetical protein
LNEICWTTSFLRSKHVTPFRPIANIEHSRDFRWGGQSLNFGLGHLNQFAWVGGFSSAPNTKKPEELVPDSDKAKEQLKLVPKSDDGSN